MKQLSAKTKKLQLLLGLNQSGAISILPMIVVIFFSSIVVYSYLKVSQDSLVRIRTRRMAEDSVYHVANQLVHRLSIEPSSGCAFWTEIQSIRNLSLSTPSAINMSYSPVSAINCFLDSKQALNLKRLDISVQPLSSSADLTNMARLVRIQVKGYSSGNHMVTRERLIRLSMASLGDNVLVLTGSASGGKLDVATGTSLHIYGSTYITGSGPAETPNLSTLGGSNVPYGNRIFFHDYVMTRGKTMSVSGDITQSQMASVFLRGIKTGVFNSVPLPTEYAASAWTQKIDYSVVYSDSPDSPLPEMPSGYTSVSGSGISYGSISGMVTTIPSGSINLTETSKTCGSSDPDMSSMTPMVLLRADADVNIDFSKNPLSYKDSDVFCGLIRARTLTVTVRSGNPARIFGRFFVDKLVVRGSGTLSVISDRASNITPPSLAPPLGFSTLSRQISGLQIFVGQPFFVPLALNPTSTFAQTPDLLAHPPSDYLVNQGCPYSTSTLTCNCPTTPTKPPAGPVCWPAVISAPTDSTTTAQITKLFSGANAAQNIVYLVESML